MADEEAVKKDPDRQGGGLEVWWEILRWPQKLAVGLGATLLLVGGVVLVKEAVWQETKVEIIEDTAREISTEGQKIQVDVSGEVLRPGVYALSVGERIQTALAAAGGLSAEADREWVAKNLNLAGKLSDGAKIYIPKAGQQQGSATVNVSSREESGGVLGTGAINVNSATVAELDTLPGIGPVTANKIISNRPYQSVEELLTKKVVNKRVYEGIKEKVGVY